MCLSLYHLCTNIVCVVFEVQLVVMPRSGRPLAALKILIGLVQFSNQEEPIYTPAVSLKVAVISCEQLASVPLLSISISIQSKLPHRLATFAAALVKRAPSVFIIAWFFWLLFNFFLASQWLPGRDPMYQTQCIYCVSLPSSSLNNLLFKNVIFPFYALS